MKKVIGLGLGFGLAALVGCGSSGAPVETSNASTDEALQSRADEVFASLRVGDGTLVTPQGWKEVEATHLTPAQKALLSSGSERALDNAEGADPLSLPGHGGPVNMARRQCAGDWDAVGVCCDYYASGTVCCAAYYGRVYCPDEYP